MGSLIGVHPKLQIFRILRGIRRYLGPVIGGAVQSAGTQAHRLARTGVDRLQRPKILGICGIYILFVRENDHIAAHGDKLFFPLGQLHVNPPPTYDEIRPVHIAQHILGDDSAAATWPCVNAPPLPGAEDGISAGGHVLHFIKSPLRDPGIVVIPPEHIHHLAGGLGGFQPRVMHGSPSFQKYRIFCPLGVWVRL